ncbi:cytochrome-c peroxidase [Trinickia dinghuensis]|uniref:Cytochrome-c peroxidase n=1 Tax=Trinickia dinghuensis TaxID=2291023 RepID=A0A3D8K5K9_9BURK|nr:cytochrome c peroxidase [Trinickia dinghuensis]RDV00511.1 cytochrome-c peroxidase [Trinickia dinghuensis]
MPRFTTDTMQPLDSALPNPPADRGNPTARRRLLVRVIAIGVLVAAAGACAWALAYPERTPPAVGNIVEQLTGANPHPVHLERPPVAPLSAMAELGKQIFFDQNLSASGKLSCASCHSPAHAYGPPNALPVQFGGPSMTLQGDRPPPSLMYLYRQPNFSIGPDASDADAAVNYAQEAVAASGVARAQKTAGVAPAAPAMVPQGGMFWDGRADTLQAQAFGPLMNPVEMANTSEDDVARKLSASAYRDDFLKLFGPNIFKNQHMLLSEAMFAVARYQVENPTFHPYSSKYDYWLEGRARLTHAEMHGLQLFNDPKKANCAGCHLSKPSPDGLPPMFTDYQYEALGVPRNNKLAANHNSSYYDMGICGPYRTDLSAQTQYCGMFLTPTLRNAATRHVFFHNGVYHTLDDVMKFYNLRDIAPGKIYPHDGQGHVLQYDDLPAKYHANIDKADAPFDRNLGDPPSMTDDDIKDIIAFLNTLTDGYQPNRSTH